MPAGLDPHAGELRHRGSAGDDVLMHGFTLDETLETVQLSAKTVEPQKVMAYWRRSPCDVGLCATDDAYDERIGPEIEKHHRD